jgi:hypothetical protein
MNAYCSVLKIQCFRFTTMDALTEANSNFDLNLLKKLVRNNSGNLFYFYPWTSPQPWQWSTWGWREALLPRQLRYLKRFPKTINAGVSLSIETFLHLKSQRNCQCTHNSAGGTRMRMGSCQMDHGTTVWPSLVVRAQTCGYCTKQLSGRPLAPGVLVLANSWGHCPTMGKGNLSFLLGPFLLSLLFIFIIVVLGYIVTFIKFLTKYHSWIHSLHHSPLYPFPLLLE